MTLDLSADMATSDTLAQSAAYNDALTKIQTWANAQGLFSAYTPSWNGAVVNPALGNGTLTGRYSEIGKTVNFNIRLTMGSTTTYGSSFWTFTLPASSNTVNPVNLPYGTASINDLSSGNIYTAQAVMHNAGDVVLNLPGNPDTGPASATVPFTFATGDTILISGTYEAA